MKKNATIYWLDWLDIICSGKRSMLFFFNNDYISECYLCLDVCTLTLSKAKLFGGSKTAAAMEHQELCLPSPPGVRVPSRAKTSTRTPRSITTERPIAIWG